MKVGIELRSIVLGQTGGITILIKGLLETLFALHPEHEYFVFVTLFNRGILERLPVRGEILTLPTATYFADVDRLAVAKDIDVLFRSYPHPHRLDFPLARQVFLIPDIQHEYFPEFFDAPTLSDRRTAFTQTLAEGGAIGTISEFARQTLQEQPCTRCQDIFLISPALPVASTDDSKLSGTALAAGGLRGANASATPVASAIPLTESLAGGSDLCADEQNLIPAGDFFLCPANLWPHKNHRRVLQAFRQFLVRTGRGVQFIFTGHPDGWDQLQAEFADLPIRHLGFVRGPLLRALMSRTQALVFFSLYEGFGMPLLEAFQAGTPVICSNTTSLPEIGGDAVLSCDPTDVHAMSGLMARILQEPDLRQTLTTRGKQRLTNYTWEQSAQNLNDAFERVASRTTPILMPAESARRPLVSIVTPSYNQGRFLRRTIESVLNQTYPHIEYVVMDGSSTDESVDILKSYGDRVTWVSERDRGQTDAINKGFARTHGEIQAYLNSDDVLLPDAVEKVVSYFVRHPQCDMLYGEAYYTDEDDRLTGKYRTADYSFDRLMADCCVCQPAAFWRTRMAEQIGSFDDRLHYAMDFDYWIRIDRAGGRIEHLQDVLACSRMYAETKTMSARKEIHEEIFRVCTERTGSVSESYFHGYWHHLCRERSTGWPRRLRWLPKFEWTAATLHHRWWHRHQFSLRDTLKQLRRSARRRAKRLVPRALRSKLWPSPACGQNVNGLWPDNWLEPQCTIRVSKTAPGQTLKLSGVAPVDSVLTVLDQGHVLGQYPLRAQMFERIHFQVTMDSSRKLELTFSSHVTDSNRRPLAFLLQETNLFCEHDLG